MNKKKLEISDELKLHLKQMREALAGVSLDGDSDIPGISRPHCGAYCQVTCAHYCESYCNVSCAANCKDIMAMACTTRLLFPFPQ